MKAHGVSQYALIHKHHISPAQITRLKRNDGVSTHTVNMLCSILDCKVEDIMEYIGDSVIDREQFYPCRNNVQVDLPALQYAESSKEYQDLKNEESAKNL